MNSLVSERLHRARNWSKADVLLAEWPPESGRRVVIKDFGNSPLWFRLLAGRYHLSREWHVLRFLKGTPGAPEAIARPDADCLVMAHCPGRPANEFSDGALPEPVLRRLEQLVAALHARGVTHGDLHQDNILVAQDGSVTLIDWATACVFGSEPRGLKALSFAEWRALDDRAVAKLKVLHAPNTISASEQSLLLDGGSRLYRGVKRLRRWGERLRGRGRPAGPAPVIAKYTRQLEAQQREAEPPPAPQPARQTAKDA